MKLAHKTTEQLEKRYRRLGNLNQLNNNRFLQNALNRDQPAHHVATFYQEMARRNSKAIERIGRELEIRYRKQELEA